MSADIHLLLQWS